MVNVESRYTIGSVIITRLAYLHPSGMGSVTDLASSDLPKGIVLTETLWYTIQCIEMLKDCGPFY